MPAILPAQLMDNVGAGRAITFDGVNDYIDLGDVYDDLAFPLTISVWVNIDSGQPYAFPIFNSQDNLPIYNGVTFLVTPHNFSIGYGDGRGENNPSFRRAKSASLPVDISGRWVSLTVIMRGSSDMDLFLNGVNMGGSYDGSTLLPMESSSPGDVAKIGYWKSNGITSHFKGLMDELRIFDRALSEDEIRMQMCMSLKGDEPGLIGYWTFDETDGDVLHDSSPNGYDGALMGNPTRVFSGAPIGDESVCVYPAQWSGMSLEYEDITVENVTGDPFGIHIYKVNDVPSQTTGLDASTLHVPYYGVFIADEGQGNSFDILHDQSCGVYSRADNSEPQWNSAASLSGIVNRNETIFNSDDGDLGVSLGTDQTICDVVSHQLIASVDDASGKTFLWSTGESSSSIVVNQSGAYSVTVMEGCSNAKDTVHVTFLHSPPEFSLGDDRVLCEGTLNLEPNEAVESEGTWSDGSIAKNLLVTEPGTYWLTFENACGSATDSVTVSDVRFPIGKVPNVITPDGNDFNQYFVLEPALSGSAIAIFNRWGKQVYESFHYTNQWDAFGLASGTYFYVLSGACNEQVKGIIHVLR